MLEDPAILKLISNYVLETFLSVYRKHPQWLNKNYKKYPWHSQEFKVEFTSKLLGKLRQTKKTKAIVKLFNCFLS